MKSRIISVNVPGSQFPTQNLPYGVFCRSAARSRCCVAIGDGLLDLRLFEETRLVDTGCAQPVSDKGSFNPFMALGPGARRRLRRVLPNFSSTVVTPRYEATTSYRRQPSGEGTRLQRVCRLRCAASRFGSRRR
jgi:hypothetical protein